MKAARRAIAATVYVTAGLVCVEAVERFDPEALGPPRYRRWLRALLVVLWFPLAVVGLTRRALGRP